MATRKIVLYGDEVLRKRCREVAVFDAKLGILLDDMIQTLHKAEGVGLAASQVGVLKRVVVIDLGDEHIFELVNPVIIKQSGLQTGAEGCLSYPGEYGIVDRPNEVTIEAYDRHGKKFQATGTELLARAFCHEIDHLDGKLFLDIAARMVKLDEDDEESK